MDNEAHDQSTRGLFIVIEGPDGVGKTTKSHMLYNKMKDSGFPVLLTREPGGNEYCEEIRRFLINNSGKNIKSDLMLIMAARAEHVSKIILPAINNGVHVICDRYLPSSIVYQGYLGGIEFADIMNVHNFVTNCLTPDLVFFLDSGNITEQLKNRGNGNSYDNIDLSQLKRLCYNVCFKVSMLLKLFNESVVIDDNNRENSLDIMYDIVRNKIQLLISK